MSARYNSKANGLPGKPTHELGYGMRNPGARSAQTVHQNRAFYFETQSSYFFGVRLRKLSLESTPLCIKISSSDETFSWIAR